MSDKKFSKEHEWITVNGDTGTVGISDYAQKQLGDIVYVSFTRELGEKVKQFDDVAEIESVKSVSQVFTPVSGEIVEFNKIFEDETKSGIINQDPYGEGWLFKIKIDNKQELNSLMTEEEYNNFIKNL
ncbi:MAG TPA: glycine cleavage system protein GcvH [Spirochaetota bacterium]|nr:glycine cleavage system protein GcvH [Spirochaetota bacterium]HOL57262.1 glycine cleavage system protein GcvH [Spirochaetota bacterium]HPP04870.1 glycine cleavage system protein GcvH [Spirochaetota bacterium]